MQKEIMVQARGIVDAADDIDSQIAEQIDVVRGIQERIASLQDKIEAAKVELRELLEQKGSNWADSEGYARIVADSIRLSYQTKALDELIIKDPLHYGWLKDYRKESPVRGGLQVK